jgi:SAM-dependent methyltransferase
MLRRIVKAIYVRHWVLPKTHRTYAKLSVADAFRKIYLTRVWGGAEKTFCSGSGSRGNISQQYCDFLIEFIRDHEVKSVVDLGCGDFAVGSQIVESTGVLYMGFDVVPELIEHLKKTVHDPRVQFCCADIMNCSLPAADLYLVRQVLQHLSNEEIAKVIANLGNARQVLISEHLPAHPKSVNRDKPHGPDVRSLFGSGVYLDQPPFSKTIETVSEMPLPDGSLIRTVMIRNVHS